MYGAVATAPRLRTRSGLRRGDFRRLPASARGVLAYGRAQGPSAILVVVNVGDRAITTGVAPWAAGAAWRVLLSTHDPAPGPMPDGGRIRLRPLEAVLLAPEV